MAAWELLLRRRCPGEPIERPPRGARVTAAGFRYDHGGYGGTGQGGKKHSAMTIRHIGTGNGRSVRKCVENLLIDTENAQ